MITNTHIINRSLNQASTQNNQQHFNRAVAVAQPVTMMNIFAQTRVGQMIQLIPNEIDMKWLLENFSFKKLFRAIA